MSENDRWSIRGVTDEARRLATEAAAREAVTVGAWVSMAIGRYAEPGGGHVVIPPGGHVGGHGGGQDDGQPRAVAAVWPTVDFAGLGTLLSAVADASGVAGMPVPKGLVRDVVSTVRVQLRASRGLPERRTTRPTMLIGGGDVERG